MNKYIAGLIAAVLSSGAAFIIHVFSQERVLAWVTQQMQGRGTAPAWDVRYIAGLTSVETGVGLVVLYALLRPVLPAKSSVVRGLLLGVLLLAIMGRLFRQPLMDLVVGNPISVVVVQDGIAWVVWLVASVVVAVVYDRLAPGMGANNSFKPTPLRGAA